LAVEGINQRLDKFEKFQSGMTSRADGSSCRQEGADRGAFGEAAAIVATMAEAQHHAHRNGLVHRDVKPGKHPARS
jgi:serine/threonine protein kinase